MGSTLELSATEAAIAGDVVVFESRRDVVEAVGPDAADYLQGQLSQEAASMPVGSSAWSFLLAPNGKIDGWFRLTRRAEDRFLLDTDVGGGEALLARLERFKLRTDVEFTLDTVSMRSLRGPATASLLAGASPDAGVTTGAAAPDGPIAVDALWPGVDGVDLLDVGSGDAGSDIPAVADVAAGAPEAFEAARIEAGIPALGAEIVEATIPAELGVVDRSVSFTKGCYVGQELVARVDSRGNNTPRTMMVLHLVAESAGASPGGSTGRSFVGATLSSDEREDAGVVTSAAVRSDGGVVALASIRRGVEPGTRVAATVDGHRWSGTVSLPSG